MELMVLTKNYGKDFTGATTSTFNLIQIWTRLGIDVTVVTMNIVGPQNNNIKIIKLKNYLSLLCYIKNNKTKVWYSDDHFGVFLALGKCNYIHTYHGNWPTALFGNGFKYFIKGLILMNLYIITIKKSFYCSTVSEKALTFVRKYNSNSGVIRNGLNIVPNELVGKITFKKPLHIIMVGNIDKRKYENLIKVLKENTLTKDINFNIDIYGRIIDRNIEKQLEKLPFVKVKGFSKNVPYTNYDLFLSLSSAENLSIALVEAIASGIPVLGLKVGGMEEVVTNGDNGFLITNTQTVFCFLNEKIFNTQLLFNNKDCINDFNWENSAIRYKSIFEILAKKLG